MFRFFSTHYVWDLSINLALEMGAKIGDVQEICSPLKELSNKTDAAASIAFRESCPK